MKRIVVSTLVLGAALLGIAAHQLVKYGRPVKGAYAAEKRVDPQADSAKDDLLRACAAEGYEFTPKLREAFLSYSRQLALAGLEAKEKSLPRDFLSWVESAPGILANRSTRRILGASSTGTITLSTSSTHTPSRKRSWSIPGEFPS